MHFYYDQRQLATQQGVHTDSGKSVGDIMSITIPLFTTTTATTTNIASTSDMLHFLECKHKKVKPLPCFDINSFQNDFLPRGLACSAA